MSKKMNETNAALIHVDGACSGNPGDTGLGIVICDADSGFKEEISQYAGIGTNNFAEYKALIVALERAHELNVRSVQVRSDSELLVKQLKGLYKVKKEHLQQLYEKVCLLASKFDSFGIEHVRREFNAQADSLAKKAITEFRRTNRMAAAQEKT